MNGILILTSFIGPIFSGLGGGRIEHKPGQKYIKVYGYSMGFGRADHTKVVEVLKQQAKYSDYTIEWSNDGY